MVENHKPVTLLKMFKGGTGFSSTTRSNIGGRCGFQVLDQAVAWILSRGGPTIRREVVDIRFLLYDYYLWSPIFLDYLLLSAEMSSAVTLPRDK